METHMNERRETYIKDKADKKRLRGKRRRRINILQTNPLKVIIYHTLTLKLTISFYSNTVISKTLHVFIFLLQVAGSVWVGRAYSKKAVRTAAVREVICFFIR